MPNLLFFRHHKLISLLLIAFTLPSACFCHDNILRSALSCRDPNFWPFSSESVWNSPIRSNATFVPAGIFSNIRPVSFFSDDDYFFTTTADDPMTPWYNQGWWGAPGGLAHCNVTGPRSPISAIPFPKNVTVTAFGNNNAAGILMPDNDTLVLTQPLYRCEEGSPILSRFDFYHGLTSIRGNGTWGGHGGSSLSAVGGTIRLGELVPSAPAIRHALKLELFAHDYYYGKSPCYRWPALNCDNYAFDCKTDPQHCYNGTNPLITPGALLAVPMERYDSLKLNIQTVPGKSILWTLVNYGGYLVDDTYCNRGTICTQHGVTAEFESAWGFPFNADDRSGSPRQQQWFDDLLLIFQNLQVVSDNTPSTVGGSGEPLQPPPPPLCV